MPVMSRGEAVLPTACLHVRVCTSLHNLTLGLKEQSAGLCEVKGLILVCVCVEVLPGKCFNMSVE